MNRRLTYPQLAKFCRSTLLVTLVIGLVYWSAFASDNATAVQDNNGSLIRNAVPSVSQTQEQATESPSRIVKTDRQWRQQLTDLEYEVTRKKGTERAYSGKYWNQKEKGIYTCKCCGQPLFDSKTKFKSGTGWPSFHQPINATAIKNVTDRSGWMVRTETVCSRCDAHLGHVFDDGPRPTGLRYCMNSVALGFEKAGVAKPPATHQVAGAESTKAKKVDPAK